MVEMMFGAYAFLWWLIFKKLKLLPINLWTCVTSVFILLVVLFMGFVFLGRYQPMTHRAQTYAITTPIVAEAQGKVIEVPVTGGEALKRGDVLFTIDPTQHQARVDSVSAQLELAKTRLAQETELTERGAGNRANLDRAQSDVDRLEAELRLAQYTLDATVVTAPADGYVTQVVIRPGQFVMPMVFAKVMVFVHDEGPYLVADFDQSVIEHIDPGDEAEVAFDAAPGRVFTAKVQAVQPLLAEGTLSARGSLETFNSARRRGRVPVLLTIEDDVSEVKLPAGSNAIATVYTGKKHHLNLLRKIILRIKSWENWVPFSVGIGH
jgi:multidrug resistance efflux pump